MPYKTILVHVDNAKNANERIHMAIRCAAMENAHLIGAALTGVSRYIYETASINPDDPGIMSYLDILRQRARDSLEKFEDTVRRTGDMSYETRLIDDEAMGGLSLHARYADLVILGQFDPEDASIVAQPNLPEFVAMNSGCPVLLIPHASISNSIGERVLISWNGSLEARRAIQHALPILQRAKSVEVIVFNPSIQKEVFGEQPGADLALYLARHGVKVNVIQEETRSDIGEALLSLAANRTADMIVIGCYGHSRFREILLGGTTLTLLRSATIPVFLSH